MLIAEDNAVIDFSNGTILGGGQATFDGGIGSTLFLPIGIDPDSLFSSFNTLGDVFNVSDSVLVVPANFTMNISSDRPDLIRIEGVVRPEGSPSSPQSLTFTQGGVEVLPSGLLNMFNSNLTLRTDSSVVGGEIRNISTMVVGDVTDEHHTFTQTSGTSDVNSSLFVGRANDPNSTARGAFNMGGGNLSIGSTLYVGYGSTSWASYPEGTFRQTAGTTTVGSSLSIARGSGNTGSVELSDGLITVANDLSIATAAANAEGTLAIGGGTLEVGNDVTVGRSNGNSTGQLTQASGNLSSDTLTVHPGSRYDLTGGVLSVDSRFELNGTLNFDAGSPAINLADSGVLDWSSGTLLGTAAAASYTAGENSESYFPQGFNPYTEFSEFNSSGLVHSTDTVIVIPETFDGRTVSLTVDNLAISGAITFWSKWANQLEQCYVKWRRTFW